jgi:large subunit ribosomal protein L21
MLTAAAAAASSPEIRSHPPMYAVVAPDGNQHRVEVGQTIEVDRLRADREASVTWQPVMVVGDDGTVTATPGQLANATVRATVVEHTKGPKITAYMYHSKTGYHRKTGHRAARSRVRIDAIDA